jgi:hypothetical protein
MAICWDVKDNRTRTGEPIVEIGYLVARNLACHLYDHTLVFVDKSIGSVTAHVAA